MAFSYGSILNFASGIFPSGSNHHVRIEVLGDLYSAYVDGSTTPATTLNTNTFASGQVAVYDFTAQTLDNVVLAVPEPTSLLMLAGAVPLVIWHRRRAAPFSR